MAWGATILYKELSGLARRVFFNPPRPLFERGQKGKSPYYNFRNMEIVIYIIVLYFILVFGLSRFFIPHLSFGSDPLPEKIPGDMERKIEELKNKSNYPKEFLELAYNFLGTKYHSERLATVLKFHFMFKSLEDIWIRTGFIPCNQSNFLMRIFLIKSGWFKDEEIRRRQVFLNFVPHQYLQVKVDGEWLDVDVGEKYRGMPIGRHLKYFG